MKPLLALVILGSIISTDVALAQKQSLQIVYPQTNYQTSAAKIFFTGSAPPTGQVFINGKLIARSKSGYFAPSFPLQLGENLFTVRYFAQFVQIKVTRVSTEPEIPKGLAFGKDSLTPAVDIARLPGELICFSATSTPNATVSVKLGNQTVTLASQQQQAQLPANSAVLTGQNQPINQSNVAKYEGCTTVETAADLGKPEFQLTMGGSTIAQTGTGKIQILRNAKLEVAEVTVDSGVARTGPSSDYSRLTPLPKGTRAAVTGREGNWLRLDYGGWISSQETRILTGATKPSTIIRSIGYRQGEHATSIIFPLQVPVPVSVQQENRTFTLTLYNTTAQTDIIRLDRDPLISRLDWQQTSPGQIRYIFNLKKDQQWGYKLSYEGTNLVLTLRHPPAISRKQPLSGIKILVDPGHGGAESGASGFTGYLEKDVNLTVSKLLRDELVKRGANVVMTRSDDREVSLAERQAIISQEEPAIALSIHHNSLPDEGNAEKIQGFAAFWYQPQAHSLAMFIHDYVIKKLGRPDYGVYWDNLALTRPAIAPSVLLELGFMSNPNEFELVINPQEQKKIARAIADGITQWFRSSH